MNPLTLIMVGPGGAAAAPGFALAHAILGG